MDQPSNENLMKSFSELISWELEQERKNQKRPAGAEAGSNQVSESLHSKLRQLNEAQRRDEHSIQTQPESQS